MRQFEDASISELINNYSEPENTLIKTDLFFEGVENISIYAEIDIKFEFDGGQDIEGYEYLSPEIESIDTEVFLEYRKDGKKIKATEKLIKETESAIKTLISEHWAI